MEELRVVHIRIDCEAAHSMKQKAVSLAFDVGNDSANLEEEIAARDDQHELRLGVGGIDPVCV